MNKIYIIYLSFDQVRLSFCVSLPQPEHDDRQVNQDQDGPQGRLQRAEAEPDVRRAPRHRPHLQGHPRADPRQGALLREAHELLLQIQVLLPTG